MPTIVDVARRAGVGVGTVSRVLNNSSAVSDGTRSRVLSVIDDLGYRPSSLARGLSLGTTNVVGVVVPAVTRPSSMERLRGILDTLAETDYDLALYNVGDETRSARLLDITQPDRCSGGILMSLRPTEQERQRLVDARCPMVVVDGLVEGLSGCHIDNVSGGHLATRHLLDLGHQDIAFLGDIEDSVGFNPGVARFEGYRRALREAGVPFRSHLVRTGPHSQEAAHRLTHELLDQTDRPSAIVATSDTQAVGVMAAIRAHGLEVPGDVSVVGFDDLELAGYVGLTTVRQPLYESGVVGAQLLTDRLRGREQDPLVRELRLEVVVRESTAAPAG